jgi:hypothetical protein
MTHHRKTRVGLSLLATTMLTGIAGPALAQAANEAAQLEEVVVTAQKRSENLQDVPVSIQALGSAKLDQLQISDVNDYVKFLPSVTAQTASPGFSTFYMRGVASGENNNHSGPLPSVGVYLDEQPVTTITGPLTSHLRHHPRRGAVRSEARCKPAPRPARSASSPASRRSPLLRPAATWRPTRWPRRRLSPRAS